MTMDARQAAITASLNESRALLASCARRLGVKGQVATAPSLATMTTPMVMSDRVRELEQQTTDSSPSSLFSAIQVVGAGAPQTSAVFAAAMPTRCSTEGRAHYTESGHVGIVFPASGSTHLLPATTLTLTGNRLQGAGATGTYLPANCSTHVLTSPQKDFVHGARVVNTSQPPKNPFPHFDGTNPSLWRENCLEFFTKFNISKPFWTTAAKMHMDGKAKEWFEAYRLRQVVGDWPEFINDVEAHFGVRDLPPSTTMLGAAHPSSVVHVSADISPDTTNACLPASLKEVMVTIAEPALVQLAESIQLQFAQLKLTLDS